MFTDLQALNPDAPARYRICAQGAFDARWLDMLSGVWVVGDHHSNELHTSVFVGCVADQAALFGVLNHLYNLGLCLISVEWLTDAPKSMPPSKAAHRHPSAFGRERCEQPLPPPSNRRSGP